VASTRNSTIEPLAQRARKILQEEGAHKVHAEAWAKRICRIGGSDLELLLERVQEMWQQASRWPGEDDDPGYRAAIEQGMVSEGPDAIRRRVHDWMCELFGAEGVTIVLADPK
jgi:1,2-phenylacetyl-CoA epoxidase catalytic subunit